MGLIRFILAFSVVVFHAQAPFLGIPVINGWYNVPLFFIISGFYMSMILNGKYNSYYSFITNRFLKIFPIYWIVLTVGFVASYQKSMNYLHEPLFLWRDFFYVIFSNIFIFGSELLAILDRPEGQVGLRFIGFNDPQNFQMGSLLVIGPVWSLSIELMFYLLAPFCLKRGKIIPFLLLLAAGLGWDFYLMHNEAYEIPWNYNLFPSSLKFFVLGAIAYKINVLYLRSKFVTSYKKTTKVFEALCYLALLTIFYNSQFVGGIYMYLPTLYALSLSLALLMIPVFHLTAKFKIDRAIGDLSYPIYISHFLFIEHIKLSVHPIVPTFLLSCFLLWGIIWPVNKFRQRRALKQTS